MQYERAHEEPEDHSALYENRWRCALRPLSHPRLLAGCLGRGCIGQLSAVGGSAELP